MCKKCEGWQWSDWVDGMVFHLENKEIDRVANLLACCCGDPESRDDQIGMKAMFGHPILKGQHKKLWESMRQNITPEYQGQVAQTLRSYGWSI